MRYSGEYILKLEKGSVEIPWKDENLKNAVWVLVETAYEDSVSVDLFIEPTRDFKKTLEEYKPEGAQIKILETGTLDLSSGYLWAIPQRVREFLEEEAIIFIGQDVNIQVLSKKQHEEIMDAERDLQAFLDEYFLNEKYDAKSEMQKIAYKLAGKNIKGDD